jgi:hypothetical protein
MQGSEKRLPAAVEDEAMTDSETSITFLWGASWFSILASAVAIVLGGSLLLGGAGILAGIIGFAIVGWVRHDATR